MSCVKREKHVSKKLRLVSGLVELLEEMGGRGACAGLFGCVQTWFLTCRVPSESVIQSLYGCWHGVVVMLWKGVSASVAVNVVTCSILLKDLPTHTLPNAASSVSSLIVDTLVPIFGTMIKCFGRVGDVGRVRDLWEQMTSRVLYRLVVWHRSR